MYNNGGTPHRPPIPSARDGVAISPLLRPRLLSIAGMDQRKAAGPISRRYGVQPPDPLPLTYHYIKMHTTSTTADKQMGDGWIKMHLSYHNRPPRHIE